MDTLLHLIDANLARYLSVGDMLGLECAATWTTLSDVAWRRKSYLYTHGTTRDHKRALAYIHAYMLQQRPLPLMLQTEPAPNYYISGLRVREDCSVVALTRDGTLDVITDERVETVIASNTWAHSFTMEDNWVTVRNVTGCDLVDISCQRPAVFQRFPHDIVQCGRHTYMLEGYQRSVTLGGMVVAEEPYITPFPMSVGGVLVFKHGRKLYYHDPENPLAVHRIPLVRPPGGYNAENQDDVIHIGKTAMGKLFVLSYFDVRVFSAKAPFALEWFHAFEEPVYVRSSPCIMTEIILLHIAPVSYNGNNGIVIDTVSRTVRSVLINRRAVWAPSGQVAMSNGFLYKLW